MTNKAKLPPIATPKLTTDVIIFTIENEQLQVALIERNDEPYEGRLSIPGGFMWQDETSLQTAERVLASKVNAKHIFLEQLYTFDDVNRDPRGRIISVAYYALVQPQTFTDTKAQLVPIDQVSSLAFDHTKILEVALRRLRSKLLYSNIAYSVLPEQFALAQLQAVYEAVTGNTLDKRNFRKKILSLELIEPTDQKTPKAAHRPATLYTFKKRGYTELEEPAF
jgi:8-oxo-dGTP diphosphatase